MSKAKNELTNDALFEIAAIKERMLYYTYIHNNNNTDVNYFSDDRFSPIDISGVSHHEYQDIYFEKKYVYEIKHRDCNYSTYHTAIMEYQKFKAIFEIYLTRPEMNFYYVNFYNDCYVVLDLHPYFSLEMDGKLEPITEIMRMKKTTSVDGGMVLKNVFHIPLFNLHTANRFYYHPNKKFTHNYNDLNSEKLNDFAINKYKNDKANRS